MASYSRQVSDAEATKALEATLSNLKVTSSEAIKNSTSANFDKFEEGLGAMAKQLQASNAPKQVAEFQAMKKAFAATPPARKRDFVISFARHFVKVTAVKVLAGVVTTVVVGGLIVGGVVGTEYEVTMADGEVHRAFDVDNDGSVDAVMNTSGTDLVDVQTGTSIWENVFSFVGSLL